MVCLLLAIATAAVVVGLGAAQTVTSCPTRIEKDERHFHVYENYCFQIVLYHDKDYTDASEYCEHYGGTLALVKSRNIQNFLSGTLRNVYDSTDVFWIGLNDIDSEDSYVWVDGTPVDYSNWAYDQGPNHGLIPHNLEDCVAMDMDENGKWHDYMCESPLLGWLLSAAKPYICQYKIKTTTTMTTTTSTTTPQPTTTTTTTSTPPPTTTQPSTTTSTTEATTVPQTPEATTTELAEPTSSATEPLTTVTTETTSSPPPSPETSTTSTDETTRSRSTSNIDQTTTATEECSPFFCEKDCGMNGYKKNPKTGCMICECGD